MASSGDHSAGRFASRAGRPRHRRSQDTGFPLTMPDRVPSRGPQRSPASTWRGVITYVLGRSCGTSRSQSLGTTSRSRANGKRSIFRRRSSSSCAPECDAAHLTSPTRSRPPSALSATTSTSSWVRSWPAPHQRLAAPHLPPAVRRWGTEARARSSHTLATWCAMPALTSCSTAATRRAASLDRFGSTNRNQNRRKGSAMRYKERRLLRTDSPNGTSRITRPISISLCSGLPSEVAGFSIRPAISDTRWHPRPMRLRMDAACTVSRRSSSSKLAGSS